jgi:hypothetical protein
MSKEAREQFAWLAEINGMSIAFDYDATGKVISFKTGKSTLNANTFSLYKPTGGSTNKYENSYDKLHNTLEEINDLLRERERLERRYQRLIDRNSASAAQLADLSSQIVATHQLEIDKQEEVLAGRLAQIEQELASNKGLQKYA